MKSPWVKFSIRIRSFLQRFYFLKGVIWLGLGLSLGLKLVLGLGLRINIIMPELHISIIYLGHRPLNTSGERRSLSQCFQEINMCDSMVKASMLITTMHPCSLLNVHYIIHISQDSGARNFTIW
jgi:hypothetical protein